MYLSSRYCLMRKWAVVLCGTMLLCGAEAAGEPASRGDVRRGQALLAEGDALAGQGQYDDAVLKYKAAFEQILPAMRRLPFKRIIKSELTPREQLRERFGEMIDEEVPPAEMRSEEVAMKSLGLIPDDMDLKKTYIEMLSEEVAGYYDSEKEEMHLIREPAPAPRAAKEKPGLLDRLFGTAGDDETFDPEENKALLAHELTHALADQHFDLDRLHERAKGDADRELALSALIEGEAMLTMAAAQQEDWQGTEIVRMPAWTLSVTMSLMTPFISFAGGEAFQSAPPVLRETLMFPYLRGMVFTSHLTNAGGWAAIDRAYADPPLSTEQILHPSKYLGRNGDGTGGAEAGIDPPVSIDVGALAPGEGWTEVGREVVGELSTSILLRGHGGARAAAGWDGDTLVDFEGPDDRIGFLWITTWDTEAEAREFANAYAAYQAARLEADEDAGDDAEAAGAENDGDIAEASATNVDSVKKPSPTAGPFSGEGPPILRRDSGGSAYHIERRGSDVVVIEGFPTDITDAQLKNAFEAKKSPKSNVAK